MPSDIAIIAKTPVAIIFNAKAKTSTKMAAGQGYSPLKSSALNFNFSDALLQHS